MYLYFVLYGTFVPHSSPDNDLMMLCNFLSRGWISVELIRYELMSGHRRSFWVTELHVPRYSSWLHNVHNKGFHPYWKCITKEPRVIFNIKGSPHRVKCYVKLIQSFDWSKKGVEKLKVMLKVKFKGFILTLIETLWFLFLTLDLWA